jgi:hypothetical protein
VKAICSLRFNYAIGKLRNAEIAEKKVEKGQEIICKMQS